MCLWRLKTRIIVLLCGFGRGMFPLWASVSSSTEQQSGLEREEQEWPVTS